MNMLATLKHVLTKCQEYGLEYCYLFTCYVPSCAKSSAESSTNSTSLLKIHDNQEKTPLNS